MKLPLLISRENLVDNLNLKRHPYLSATLSRNSDLRLIHTRLRILRDVYCQTVFICLIPEEVVVSVVVFLVNPYIDLDTIGIFRFFYSLRAVNDRP